MTAIVGKILKISTLMLILILSYSCDTMDSDDYFRFRNIDVNGCKGGYSTADEWVDWFIDGDSLVIVHHNAEYNCCLDEIEIEVERSGSVINIYEKEIASQPCFCLCPYDLEIELGNLLPGTYYIKIYHASGYLVATLIIDI